MEAYALGHLVTNERIKCVFIYIILNKNDDKKKQIKEKKGIVNLTEIRQKKKTWFESQLDYNYNENEHAIFFPHLFFIALHSVLEINCFHSFRNGILSMTNVEPFVLILLCQLTLAKRK